MLLLVLVVRMVLVVLVVLLGEAAAEIAGLPTTAVGAVAPWHSGLLLPVAARSCPLQSVAVCCGLQLSIAVRCGPKLLRSVAVCHGLLRPVAV